MEMAKKKLCFAESQQSQNAAWWNTESNDSTSAHQVGTETPVHLRHRTGHDLECEDKQGRSITHI